MTSDPWTGESEYYYTAGYGQTWSGALSPEMHFNIYILYGEQRCLHGVSEAQ